VFLLGRDDGLAFGSIFKFEKPSEETNHALEADLGEWSYIINY